VWREKMRIPTEGRIWNFWSQTKAGFGPGLLFRQQQKGPGALLKRKAKPMNKGE
jgi:hypothetical protein